MFVQAHFDAALEIDPNCRRNHYCRALAFLEADDVPGARASFRRAMECNATSAEEEDVADFFLSQSHAALQALESRQGPHKSDSNALSHDTDERD